MKFSESWLRQFVNPNLKTDELAHLITMAGLEVESIQPVAPAFTAVVVGYVIEVQKHPNADRLNVCKVNTGGEELQIVCGASNVRAGIKVPVALVGAVLPGDFKIKKSKIRSVESFGMICSETELGLAEESNGILILPEDAPVGVAFREYLDLDDQIYLLKITPNRADCLSMIGIAREVSAITKAELNLPSIRVIESSIDARKNIQLKLPEACPKYIGRVIKGINPNAKTPEYMQKLLERAGQRCIHPVVDITNYMLLKYGQPMHCFDLNKLSGDISVRFATQGEKITLLNDQEAELNSNMLVIADEKAPVAVAGIMGGKDSSVDDQTVDLFLESAFFAPDFIQGRSRELKIHTESGHRFERGVDFAQTRECAERATELILEICGGQAGPIIEVVEENYLPKREAIFLRLQRVNKVLGLNLSAEELSQMLSSLGFEFTYDEDSNLFTVNPQSYRFDIAIEADLIEEIARIYGYDNLPATPSHSDLTILRQLENKINYNHLRQILVSRDYQETINYSFLDEDTETALAGHSNSIKVANPIASQMSTMRSTLWGGLIKTLQFNLAHKQSRVRIFELGRVFVSLDKQPNYLAGLVYGDQFADPQWNGKNIEVDFYSLKQDVQSLFPTLNLEFNKATHSALHPGQCAEITLNGIQVGFIGKLHPKLQQQFDISKGVFVFELNLELLQEKPLTKFEAVSKFPSVRRDLAIVVDNNLEYNQLMTSLNTETIPFVQSIEIFDIYRGKGIEPHQKSLALKIILQDVEKTLSDEEIETSVKQVLNILETKCNAQIR